jgi:DNA-directed RNA polymerase beta subunit
MEISEFSMVEIVELGMDVVKSNKFVLKVFVVDAFAYCVEMEILSLLIGMFPSQTEIPGHNHQHVACCRKVLSESIMIVKYRKTRQLLKNGEMCSPEHDFQISGH